MGEHTDGGVPEPERRWVSRGDKGRGSVRVRQTGNRASRRQRRQVREVGRTESSHPPRWVARHGLTDSEYESEFHTYVQEQGFRLTDVTGYEVDGEARYAAVWYDVAGPPWVARHGLTASEYQQSVTELLNQGYRLTNVSGYTVGGRDRYAAIWEQLPGPRWIAHHRLTSSAYQTKFDQYANDGFRPVCVSGYTVGGEPRYAAIWEQFAGPKWYGHHGLSASAYQQKFDQYANEGFRLTDVSGYEVGGEPRYAGIWQQFSGPAWHGHHGLSASAYQQKFDQYANEGFRPVRVSGYSVRGVPEFAAIWQAETDADRQYLDRIDDEITGYVFDYDVPGLSLAITKDERLVFAKGYGYANRAAHELVHPSHRFRIASISKPITAVAVMQLAESGNPRLDDPVFGPGGILGTRYGTPTHAYTDSAAHPKITVNHLLRHTSGWDFGNDYPMFDNPNTSTDELMRHVVATRPIRHEPGTWKSYLNFGYFVLGRVVEAVSGKPYAQYVEDAVLRPCSISRMEIAGDTRPERKADEVVYYGANPYRMPVARMDAHGGWIATPTDLLRFVVHVDGFSKVADIIEPATEQELGDREGIDPGYGEGWIVNPNWRGHNGAFDGTIGYLVRRDDGISFAVLANTRPSNDQFAGDLRNRIDTAINDVRSLPTHDLF